MACESFCMEEMDVRSRSEATASRSREAGLIMHYSGCDDINKRQRSFAVIATIFIGSWSDENHLFKWRVIQSRFAGFRFASFNFFNSVGRKKSLPLKKSLPSWSETHFWP